MQNKNIKVVRNLIQCLSLDELKKPEIVANLVRAFGIVQWGHPVFGDEEQFKNVSVDMAGIYQTPNQIAKALVYLSEFKIESYLEIGVFQGGNFIFVSEYLRRFNPDIKCTGLDPTDFLNPEIHAIIESEDWLEFIPATSDDIKQKYDLVLIDGEHTGGWPERDYNNVGKFAKICMVHDIQETTCPDAVNFWKGLHKEKVEFLDCTSELPTQGIGIVKGGKK